jgi:hypothetical protein
MNTKNGWQPYIAMNMVWNILDKSKVTADSVRLPESSVKPYFQYGIGLQKHFKDSFMAFGQVMMQNGGRNGVSLTAGIRWDIGKDANEVKQVKIQKKNNKIVKRQSKTNKNIQKSSITTTTHKAVIKHL